MKSKIKFILLIILTCLRFFADAQDPFKIAEKNKKVGGYFGAVLDHNLIMCDGSKIYEDPLNIHLESSDVQRFARKQYKYVLPYSISKRSIDLYECGREKYCVYFELLPISKTKSELSKCISVNSKNPDVIEGHIQPLSIFGYDIMLRNNVIYRSSSIPALGYDQPLIVDFALDSLTAHQFHSHLISDKALKLRYVAMVKLTSKATFEHLFKKVEESEVFREFISPVSVSGNLISVAQKMLVEKALKAELKTTLIIDKDAGITFDKFMDLFFDQLFKKNTKRIISFEQLAEEELVDFNGDRFGTDKIKHFASKIKTTSEKELDKLYQETYDNLYKKDDKTIKNIRAGLKIFGKFKINGKYDKTKKRFLKEHLKETFKNKENFRDFFEQSFEYEFDGVKYVPKGINATEVIDLSSKIEFEKLFQYISVDHAYKIFELTIK